MYSIDFNTTEGAALRRALEARLQELRVQNDHPDTSERDTALIRGKIAEVKALLAPAPKKLPAAPSYGRLSIQP